jgi:segregation and condensation protein B
MKLGGCQQVIHGLMFRHAMSRGAGLATGTSALGRRWGVGRGFVRIWQFRPGSGETTVSSPADAGPLWRKPRLARVEAVLYLARQPLTSRKIAQLANLADGNEARTLIRRLRRLYEAGTSAFQVEEVAGGYQLLTRQAVAPWLRRLLQTSLETRLSPPAMETLAVVAYQQPVLRAEIEAIRGVHCDEMLRQLLERDVIRIVGRSEDLGRPLLYGTTKRFLELFGLRHLDELPRAAEFKLSSQKDAQAGVNNENKSGTGRSDDTTSSSEPNLEEKSVTTRIRPATIPAEFSEESPLALIEALQPHAAAKHVSAAKDEDEDEDDDDLDDDDDDDDDEDDDDEDDDFVDEEWEEVDDDEEDDEDEDDDDEEWEDDEDEEWEDDDEDDDDEDEEEDEKWEDGKE